MADDGEKEAVKIEVPREDPKKDSKDKDTKDKDGKKGEKEEEDSLSAEDTILKESLELAVERLKDPDGGVVDMSLETMRREVQTATTSMTSVPKPLKFLSPMYGDMTAHYQSLPDGEQKKHLADILSVIGMCFGKEGERECLNYKLQGHPLELGEWGHEYVRALAGEIAAEYNSRITGGGEGDGEEKEAGGDGDASMATKPDVSDLLAMVDVIVPFHLQHNSEPEAVDILFEVQQLPRLTDQGSPAVEHITSTNFSRIVLYLLGSARLASDPDDFQALLTTAFTISKTQGDYVGALRVALLSAAGGDDMTRVQELFDACEDEMVHKQMAFVLGRHHANFEHDDDDINEIISNIKLHEMFLGLARELDVEAAKTPEDIYKSHLGETNSLKTRRGPGGAAVESARQNLASTYVNAFVNSGYGQDTLMTADANPEWLFVKNKEHGMMAAAASLGMIHAWDTEEGLTHIDKFLYASEDYVKAGAVLAVGIVSTGVRNECDPALALLSEHVSAADQKSHSIRSAAVLGLGLAYCCSRRDDVQEVLAPGVEDDDATSGDGSMLERSLAALSLGMVFAGSCNEEVSASILQRLMSSSDAELDQTHARFLCLGLGLLFLGAQDRADAVLEAVRTVEHPMGKYTEVVVSSCAYAATGNVLKVQEMLHLIAEGLEEKKEKDGESKDGNGESADAEKKDGARDIKNEASSVAVLGIALICMGEDVSSTMALRTFDHILQYGERHTRIAIPLALALLSVSKPEYSIIDTLSRLTHDHDSGVAMCGILALGLVGAGTNNSRVAGLLRNLADFYAREANPLFVVRIAQGLLHAGKGLTSFTPFHSDGLLMSHSAVAGLLTVLHAAIDMPHTVLDKTHYLLYSLSLAMNPRLLICLDEELNTLQTSVRVGQAVDTVGLAGKPKAISGFQTHTTPVLLGVGDRAELANERHLPLSSVLEGFIILKPNPDFVEDTDESKHLR